MDPCDEGLTFFGNFFYSAFRPLTRSFSTGVARWPRVSGRHSLFDRASELIREEAARPRVGTVDGASAKVEVVTAIVNIIRSQMFIGFLGLLKATIERLPEKIVNNIVCNLVERRYCGLYGQSKDG